MERGPAAEDPAVELARLGAEHARLRGLLGLDDRPPNGHSMAWSPTLLPPWAAARQVGSGSSSAAKLERFRSLFGARSDVYALRWENPSTGKSGWSPATRGGWSRQRRSRPEYLPLSDDTLASYLRGQADVGIYPLLRATGAPGDPRIRLQPGKHGGRVVVPLTRQPRGVHAWKVVIPPERGRPRLRAHEGYEWLYVLSGGLRLLIADRDFTMGFGEVAEFDTRVPHWFGTANNHPVEILSVLGREGERIHIRAAPKQKPPGT